MSAFDDRDLARVAEELVRIPSVSRAEARAAGWFAEALATRGFRAEVDAAGNPVGAIGDGPVTVALVGHVDTVPGDLPVHVTDGVLHGRGSVDAKGPLVTLAAAARRAVDAGARARFVVCGCVEEEAPSSRGARHLLATWDAPDALVVGEPSGWDGVTLGYKGYLRLRATFEREGAHGAHDDASAPELACGAWSRVARAAARFAPADASLYDRLLTRLHGVASTHDGVRDRATLELALRLPEALPPEAADEWARERLGDCAVDVLGSAPAWSGPRSAPVARALGRAILERGGRPRFQRKTGTADLNLLAPAWGCPAVAYGPGDAALDHRPDERVPLEELARGADVLAAALVKLAGELGRDALQPASARPTPTAASPTARLESR